MMSVDGAQFGNYRLVKEIARGAFGTVYLAQHTLLTDRLVAVKVLHRLFLHSQQERDAFLQEAQFLEQLKGHPFILPLLDVGVQQDIPFLITEYAASGSLAMRLQAPQPLTFDESLTIVSQIGQALQYAHQHNIIHRDLKPGNILFNQRGEALLADFGIAALLSAASMRYTNPVGTPAYMAPEQLRGQVSRETDQYSLGCVAYELFTGRKPFTAPDMMALAFQHANEQPIPPTQLRPELPQHVELALLKAMSKQREDRYPDIATFIAALQSSPDTLPLNMPSLPSISTAAPSAASTSLYALEAQRETELFEKDLLFEEYIVKRVQQKSHPPTWRMSQPSCRWMIRWAIIASSVVALPGILIALVLAEQEAFDPAHLPPITWLPFLIIVAVLAILISGLVYGILRLYWMIKNQVLVITPNGCMYLEWGFPVSMIRYSTVTSLSYDSYDQKLSAHTNLLNIQMSLARFETPEIIAQYIDEAYRSFQASHRRSAWSNAFLFPHT